MMKISKSKLFLAGLISTTNPISSWAQVEAKEDKRPNILLIMTDDHTTQAISAYGSQFVETPNIDRIANQGIKFNNSYVTNALSGPSRACIMTGKLGHVNGFTDNASVFEGGQVTYPKLLQENGYHTAIIGKWHLISEPQGFDHYSILSGQEEQGDYYNPDFLENGKNIIERGYVTDILTEKAIAYLQDFSEKEDKKPFALMLYHKAPHRNWMPAERHLGLYKDVVFPVPSNLFDNYEGRSRAPKEQDCNIANTLRPYWDLKLATEQELNADKFEDQKFKDAYNRMPASTKKKWHEVYDQRIEQFNKLEEGSEELVLAKYQAYMQDYLATTEAVDEGIGKVLDYLEAAGELENTLIIYTSDQGFFLGEHGFFDKRFMYEECQRMPLLMSYPKMIRPGVQSDAMVMNIDFAPTFLDLAGVEIPKEIQGESILPVLINQGNIPSNWRDAVYYHYFEYPAEHSVKRHYGIRTEKYKLIHFYNDIDEWEMYDMDNDPNEMNNIYNDPQMVDTLADLKDQLENLRKKYKDSAL